MLPLAQTKSLQPLSLVVFLALVLPGVQVSAQSAQDVVAQCSKAGNNDHLQKIPNALAPAAQTIFGTEMPIDMIESATVFRCMGGKVWLCNAGANLVCEKANVKRNSLGARNWCRDHVNSKNVPAAATGHDTIYTWACAGAVSRISGQVFHVDRRGFIEENWRRMR
jgi:hypothetical protein